MGLLQRYISLYLSICFRAISPEDATVHIEAGIPGTSVKGTFMRVFLLEHTRDELPTPENAKILVPLPKRRTEYLLGPSTCKELGADLPALRPAVEAAGVPEVEICHDNPFRTCCRSRARPRLGLFGGHGRRGPPHPLVRWVVRGSPQEPAWEAPLPVHPLPPAGAPRPPTRCPRTGWPAVELPPELPLVPTRRGPRSPTHGP